MPYRLVKVEDIAASDGIEDLSVITKELIEELFPDANESNPVYLVKYDMEGQPITEQFDEQITCTYDGNNLIKANGDINVLTVEAIKSVQVNYTPVNQGYIRILVSNDSGNTWLKYGNTGEVTQDMQPIIDWHECNIDNINPDGMTDEELVAVPENAWSPLLTSNKLRFAYTIVHTNPEDNAIINNIQLTYKYEGVWTNCILGTDVTYYKGTDFVEVKFLKANTYLVNY